MEKKNSSEDKIQFLIEKGWNLRNFQNFEIRAKEDKEEKDNNDMTIEGVACVFDTETTLFEWEGIEYKEKVDKNAFKEADISDVIFNYNHGGRVYARTRIQDIHGVPLRRRTAQGRRRVRGCPGLAARKTDR